MHRRVTVAVAALATAALTASPALAMSTAKKKPKPKPIKGSWSFTDTTPDPTVSATSLDDPSEHCHGKLPAGPADVNTGTIKVSGRGVLTVTGSVIGDWAMEVRDSKGRVLAGDDENPPKSESTSVDLTKGTWTVVFCNLSGAPTASATYLFVYR
jgi:hypothetical protein